MPPPKVSYVVAAYNHERYVGELLRSLREQTFRDLEIVVVDDGSSDHTAGIVRQAAQDDPRIQLHQQTNAGVVAARNAGVAKSVGEFISVVDSDDLFPADRTAKMVAALEQSNAGLVYGDAEILHADGARSRFSKVYPVVEGPFSEALFTTYCFVPACAVMFRRSVFSRTGGFWGPGPSTDYLKWIEIGLDALVVSLPGEILGTWRLHGENVSQADASVRVRQYDELRRGLQELVARHSAFGEKLGAARQNHRYSRCYMMAGFYAARAGDWALARQQFKTARSYERSTLNAALEVSTLPLLRVVSSIAYAFAARKWLGRSA